MRVNKCYWNKIKVYGCMMVPILWFLVLGIVPSLMTVVLSFTDMSATGTTFNWVGWHNYDVNIFRQNARDFWAAVRRTVQYAVIVCCVQNVAALLLALLLNSKLVKGRSLVRGLVFVPFVLGTIVCIYAWVMMMGYKGPVLELVQSLGLAKKGLLNNPTWAFPSLMFIAVWMGCGYNMVLDIAGLQGIPQELYEAASIDGAGVFARFFKITFPMLWGTLAINLLLAIVGAMGAVEIILYTTGGLHDTQTLGMRIYIALFGIGTNDASDSNLGISSSQSMVQFVLTSIVALTTRWLTNKVDVME